MEQNKHAILARQYVKEKISRKYKCQT